MNSSLRVGFCPHRLGRIPPLSIQQLQQTFSHLRLSTRRRSIWLPTSVKETLAVPIPPSSDSSLVSLRANSKLAQISFSQP